MHEILGKKKKKEKIGSVAKLESALYHTIAVVCSNSNKLCTGLQNTESQI